MGVSAVAARLVVTRPVHGLVVIGIAVMVTATVVFAILVATRTPTTWLAVPLFVMVSSLGLVFGNATALAMSGLGANAGSASAVIGALQFGLGALVSPLVGVRGSQSAGPLAIVMLVCAGIAVCCLIVAHRSSMTAAGDDTRTGAIARTETA